MEIINTSLQVYVPIMRTRYAHRAAAFPLGSEIIEVILFGGCPSRPQVTYSNADFPQMNEDSLTAVLRFGESIIYAQY